MRTVSGKIRPTTVMSGLRMLGRTGYPIMMAVGRGSLIGDGPGFPMNPGAGRLITTAVGAGGAADGAGGRGAVIGVRGPLGRRLTSPSSDSAYALASDWALVSVRLAGARSGPLIEPFRGGDIATVTMLWVLQTSAISIVGSARWGIRLCVTLPISRRRLTTPTSGAPSPPCLRTSLGRAWLEESGAVWMRPRCGRARWCGELCPSFPRARA